VRLAKVPFKAFIPELKEAFPHVCGKAFFVPGHLSDSGSPTGSANPFT
jgi:hypothetical protein